MKFKDMSIEEFEKDFTSFLNSLTVKELVNSLKQYAINEKEYSYNQPICNEQNYFHKFDINFTDHTKEYRYNNIHKYISENVHINEEAA